MNRPSDHLLSAAASDPALAQLCDQIIERLQAGDGVDMASLALEHPEHADQLRRLLPALEALVDMNASSAQHPSRVVPAHGTSDLAPRVLGDYRILREIGRGGMGVVYEAEQRSLNRRVALKVLPMAAALDARQFQRFQLEAQAAACLHHNNIVPVFAVGTEGGVPFYAMQYIEGRSLADVIHELRRAEGLDPEPHAPEAGTAPRLADLSTTALALSLISGQTAARQVDESTVADSEVGSPLPQREGARRAGEGPPSAACKPSKTASSTRTRDYCRNIAGLGLQAAEALDHAHTRGILHRDIKPANLLLDAEGRLWVTDFGLAQIQGNHGLTLSGDVLGTLRYMSPEQALAKRVVIDGRTDVYSLGVTLYEMLTLQPAFDGKDRAEIIRKVERDEPTPLRKLNASVPQDLETIIHKALAKEPSQRYASAKELADDLRNYLESRPIRARRPSLLDRAAKWGRRHTASVAAAGVILVLAMIGLATSTILITREQRRTAAALEQAEARFQFARKAVDEMYTQFAEKWLAKQPKLTQVQREFLEKALVFYEQFAAENAASPQARFDSAAARNKVGWIQRGLGKLDDSENSFQQAVKELEDLSAQFPGRTDYLSTLADASSKLGGAEYNLGHRETAESPTRRAVAIMEDLVSREPSNRAHRSLLAKSLFCLGQVCKNAGRNDDAEPLLRRSRDLFTELRAQGPLQDKFRAFLPMCESELGVLYRYTGRLAEAEEALRRAVREAESFLNDDPADPGVRLELAIDHAELAGTLCGVRRSQEGLAHYRQACAIFEALAKDFPDLAECRATMLTAQSNTVMSLIHAGQFVEALEVGRRWIEQGEKLVQNHPELQHNVNFSMIYAMLADLCSTLPDEPFHDPAQALKWARSAVEIAPDDGTGQQSLAWALYRTGDRKGCIEALDNVGRDGDYIGAMAYWQLGDAVKARELVRSRDRWFANGYDERTNVYPAPKMLRRIRAEAAALLGVDMPHAEAKSKSALKPAHPAK